MTLRAITSLSLLSFRTFIIEAKLWLYLVEVSQPKVFTASQISYTSHFSSATTLKFLSIRQNSTSYWFSFNTD